MEYDKIDTFVLQGSEPIEPLPMETAGKAIFESLLENESDDDAMVDVFTGETLSYRTLLEESCKLAEALRANNYQIGTVISICSENDVKYFIPVLASLYVGTILAPLNHLYMPYELSHLLKISKPKVIFCSRAVVETFIALQKEVDFIEQIIIMDSDTEVPGAVTMRDFIEQSLQHRVVNVHNFKPYDGDATKLTGYLLASSGTTGLPKWVQISQHTIRVSLMLLRDPRYPFLTEKFWLLIMPMFHSYGMSMGLHGIFEGYKCIVFRRFDKDMYLQSIQNYKIQTLLMVPPIAIFLAKNPIVNAYDLSSVKNIFCGGASLGGDIEIALKKRFELDHFGQGYAMTETNVTTHLVHKGKQKSGSVGKLVPYMYSKIISLEDGKSLGPKENGEICLKGPLVMMGYYDNETATEGAFTSDGWLRTGDLGCYDEEGYFFITGRLKELIKYKCYQVAPAELETILLTHPKVLDCAVAGRPNELAGELPTAYVVRKDNDVTEKELQEYVAGLVSLHKKLRGGVIFLSSIPRNPTGKILRRTLKENL